MGKWDDPEYRREYFRAYDSAHSEERREYHRKRRAENPDEYRERNRAYADTHREQKAETGRSWYAANKERARATRKAWYEANREKMRLYNQEYRAKNAEAIRQQRNQHGTSDKVREYQRKYHRDHAEENRARAKAWRENNPERARENHVEAIQRRRARLAGATVEKVDRAAIIARDKSICGICRKYVVPEQMSLDHIIPLSLGGPHAQWNLQVAHQRCNQLKHVGRLPSQTRLPF